MLRLFLISHLSAYYESKINNNYAVNVLEGNKFINIVQKKMEKIKISDYRLNNSQAQIIILRGVVVSCYEFSWIKSTLQN